LLSPKLSTSRVLEPFVAIAGTPAEAGYRTPPYDKADQRQGKNQALDCDRTIARVASRLLTRRSSARRTHDAGARRRRQTEVAAIAQKSRVDK
jgi:hypothetical protein